MKRLGILAHSAEGSALCYRTICELGQEMLGPHNHPDITLDLVAMGRSMPAWETEQFEAVGEILGESVARLARAECDFFICPDNTAHLALGAIDRPLPIPGIHIAEAVVVEARRLGYRKIGILGTRWTTGRNMYLDAAAALGIAALSPGPEERAFLHDNIFDELCRGIFTENARREYVRVIEKLKCEGCDSVVLGCTEIPLLIGPDQSPLPTLDSTRLLAKAAVSAALGETAPPAWRGGPGWSAARPLR